jgi:hypothetical protein
MWGMAEGLHLETVEPGTMELIRKMMADPVLEDFQLVGGTALALQLGHRKSVDIDLFTTKDFDAGKMAEYLREQYAADIFREATTGVFGYIYKIKFDLLKEPFPWLDPVEKVDGIRMPSLRDIGGMKMSAIYDDGERQKDFVDMYKLLEKHPLNTYLEHARRRDSEIHPSILKQSLLYHADVIFDATIVYMGKAIEWPAIVDRLRQAYHDPGKVFGAQQLKKDQRFVKAPRQRRGPRLG